MLPLLLLLDTCRQLPAPSDETAEVIESLEQLLISHLILPLRSSLVDLKSANRVEGEVSLASFGDRMVSLLRQFLPQLETPFLRADWKTDRHLALSMMSLLFDIAISCRPRNTPKLRRLENPWLEQLFISLGKCAETLFSPVSSVRSQKDYIRVIKWMLRKAVDHQVQLSLSVLTTLLDKASGLFQNVTYNDSETRIDNQDDNYIEWGFVSLCIFNDSNAFVIPSSSATKNERYGYRPPNKYLSALLRSITDRIRYHSIEENKDYDFVIQNVVVPLCDAFIGARDLTGFLGHWREQLSIIQERQASEGKVFDLGPSIWEDERLLLHIAQSVESSLTAGQIDEVISSAAHRLAPSIQNALGSFSLPLESLILLDCVCIGVYKDETLVKLERIILSVFSLLGEFVSRSPIEFSDYAWRIWRIKATITDRWSSLRDSSVHKRKAHSAICMASDLINRISSDYHGDNLDLTEKSYAFRFMLKFAATEDSFWEDVQFSSRSRILSAVTKLLDIMEPFCNRISHDHFGTIMRSDQISKSEQSSFRISPVDKFYFDCVNAILESPDALR